ncbi:hypothetical protein N7540_011141 [Penicillium herquei]|nr:hypothetical protein N7540_011141 [Penicillium herquei]
MSVKLKQNVSPPASRYILMSRSSPPFVRYVSDWQSSSRDWTRKDAHTGINSLTIGRGLDKRVKKMEFLDGEKRAVETY